MLCLNAHYFCFGWKKIDSCSHLPVKAPLKVWDLVTILKKLSYFTYWFAWKKRLSVLYIFWNNQSMSFGDLNREKLIILVETYWYCCMYIVYVKTHLILKDILHICHDTWPSSFTTGFRLHFVQLNTVCRYHGFFYWVFTPSHC